MKGYFSKRDLAKDLLAPVAFDKTNSLFYMSNNELGFGFIARPLSGADTKSASRLNTLMNQDWPVNTSLQFSLWAGPDIEQHLAKMVKLRSEDRKIASRKMAEFFRDGKRKDITHRVKVRDIQLIITVKTRLPNNVKSGVIPKTFIERMCNLQASLQEGLKAVGMNPELLDPATYIRICQTFFSRGENPSWEYTSQADYNDNDPINEQVFDYDTPIDVEPNRIVCGKSSIKVMSIKQWPESFYFGDAIRYLGEPITGARGIPENVLITASILFPDVEKERGGLENGRKYVNHQAYGPLLKHVPRLAKRKRAFDVMYEAMDDGDRPVRMYLGIAIWADHHGLEESEISAKEHAMVSNVKTYWREMGFHLVEDSFIALPAFLNLIPFGADLVQWKDLYRYKAMATRHVAPMLPLFGDWGGTQDPVLNFISRRGQLTGLSLFNSQSNYNCVIAARSGSGKSFLANEIITSYLDCGGRSWVIDVGRSYKGLCQSVDGQFIEFGEDSNICVNPFDIVLNYDEEADVLVGIVTSMAAPTDILTDFQTSSLRRVIKEQWDQYGNSCTVDFIATALLKEDDTRIQDLGHQLYAFTSKGEYGRFMNGKNNVRFDADFVVVELEELKGKPHLQQVILLQMMYQIQQAMYLGDKSKDKLLLIDEAWELLAKGNIASFIETGYRRFRKYRGSAVVITQSVNDLFDSKSGRAISENSANMFILGQQQSAVDMIEKEKRLSISDFDYRLLRTVHTVPGQFSEIFAITDYGAGVVRLVVDDFKRLLYSTDPKDTTVIENYRKQGMGPLEAVDQVLKDRQTHEH